MNILRSKPNVFIHHSFRAGDHFKFVTKGKVAAIQLAQKVTCRRFCTFLVYKNASLKVGPGVFFNNGCSINCLHLIEIGDQSIFGENVRIYDHNHAYNTSNGLKVEGDKYTTAPVQIGKNCWIGSNVIILKGVTIGDNVIVGANCLIHDSIASNSIVMHEERLIIRSL
ncbi:acyltransferase [Chryseolinea sp. T2]|uniref:acyltransferase n=1 Tax=Chryseolinea sp. T2 TaxID=3129255 RepID=UPI0030783FD9